MIAARPRRTPLLVLLALALALVAASASAQTTYRVTLVNGNEILSKYRPAEAPYDADKMLLMTEQSNTIALHKDDIAEIIAVADALGFGRRLNETTVVVGNTANDAPTEEQMQQQLQALQGGFDALFPGLPLQLRSGMPQQVQTPIFAEPGEAGRGIPVGFVTGVQPSLGNFPVAPQPPPR